MASAYTDEQIDRYLSYIQLPPHFHHNSNPPRNLEFLNALQTHQISTIPYENLYLHYSKDHRISLDPQHLYNKFMKNGRGGYCMENSIFFNHILRGLGFTVYTAGARVRPRVNGVPTGDYLGWVHIVNIVTLTDRAKYMIDVSFGGDGAKSPLPLKEGHITQNIGTQELRLVYDSIPQQIDKSHKQWIYQYRNSGGQPWNSFFCFPDYEFTVADFEVMNHFASTSEQSFQTWTVLVVKFLREGENVVGKLMMVNGDVKRNDGGKTGLVRRCETEDDRLDALKEHFGITLTEEEREGIRGRVVELGRG